MAGVAMGGGGGLYLFVGRSRVRAGYSCLAGFLAALACLSALGCERRAGGRFGVVVAGGHENRSTSLTIGGARTSAEIYTPRSSGKHAAVVLLYGTGGMVGAAPAYRWYATALADRGMVTIICPFFDASHGRQHRDAANTRLWVPAVKDTIGYLQSRPDVDPNRIGIIGFSLGGYLGMSTIARDRRVKAFADFFGPEPKLTRSEWDRFPPTLILHGGSDPIVGISNSHDFAAQLQRAGIEHQLIVYPGQHHGFTDPAATDAHTRAVDFLAMRLDSDN